MSWWKWRPAPLPASPLEAKRARMQSRHELEAARKQRAEVDRVTEGLQELFRRNGFGEAIERAMHRKG